MKAMNIKNNIIKALLFGSMLFTSIDVSAQYLATNNYYNSLLDDESAVKFRRGAPHYVYANKQMHFSPKTTVGEALSYPAFEGFSHLLLPNVKTMDLSVHLDELQKIMNIHHNVTTQNTLESLDYIAHEVEEGRQVFFSIYSPEEIKTDPSLKDCGIFFFRGNKNAPFAVVLPGGYSYRGTIHEGFPVALRIAHEGYNAFVLTYRKGSLKLGSTDLIRAINLIRRNYERLNVYPEHYSVWGAAVGAQIAINAVQHGYSQKDFSDPLETKPSVNVLSYPLSFYPTRNDVPTVIVVGENDKIVNKTILKSSIAHLNKLGIESKYISIPRLEHGFGVGFNPSSTVSINWIGRATSFWEDKAGFDHHVYK